MSHADTIREYYAAWGDREAYAYLVESIRRFPRQEELVARMREAGLGRPDRGRQAGDAATEDEEVGHDRTLRPVERPAVTEHAEVDEDRALRRHREGCVVDEARRPDAGRDRDDVLLPSSMVSVGSRSRPRSNSA